MVPPDDRSPEGTESWNLTPARAPTEKKPYLLVVDGPQLGDIFDLQPGRELVLGRDPSSDVRLRDTGVSRRHAGLTVETGGARLRDLGSTNGTFVDGLRVGECLLRDGQRLQLGMHSSLAFCLADDVEIRYQRRLAEGALLDPETGLFNRRHFDDRLNHELVAAQRYSRPVSLLLVDVDGFRRTRERLGAQAGEQALELVARLLQSAVRRVDVLARLDGTEFGVVSRETPVSAARALAERIRRTVEEGHLTLDGEEIAFTVSVGVASVDSIGTFTPGRTERAVLDIAGAALRQARDAGGNRVQTQGPLSLP